MLKLSKLKKSKRGVSEVVAYVLLIVMAVSIAAMVFAWLKSQPSILEDSDQECPEGTKILLYGVKYFESDANTKGNLSFEIINKGLFTVQGYIIRVNYVEGEKIGAYVLDRNETIIIPGNSSSYFKEWNKGSLESESGNLPEPLTYLNIQPWVNDTKTGKRIYCKETSSAELKSSTP